MCPSRFWNQLFLSPVRSACGRVLQYVCIQADVSAEVERARQEQLAELGRSGGANNQPDWPSGTMRAGCMRDCEMPKGLPYQRMIKRLK